MKKQRRNWRCFWHKMSGLAMFALGLYTIKLLDGDATVATFICLVGIGIFIEGKGECFYREVDD